LIESSFLEEVKHMPARSYGQFCGLARALDAVGDRWSLLIVRELLPGPMRYGELIAALGGIATKWRRQRRLPASLAGCRARSAAPRKDGKASG
jgi:hypothetical protein